MVARKLPLWLAILLFLPFAAGAQKCHTYVGQVSTDSVLLAWGTTEGRGNTIGRGSTPLGRAEVRIDHRVLPCDRNWTLVTGLRPDEDYPYEVLLDGRKIGDGEVRTWPNGSDRLAFFVIGDYGTGTGAQYELAEVMWKEFDQRRHSGPPVRFVLTTGDNIYGWRHSGSADTDWDEKFFRPYERLLRHIPFYPTLGNHDGNESEWRGDLAVYLDNFFFPTPEPARYYSFSFGGLAEFFALDTTRNTLQDSPAPAYAPGAPQHRWLEKALSSSRAPWKIPYFHHPPFNAGPGHGASLPLLRHFVDLFERNGVKVVFNGHEHNFQISVQDSRTGGVCYVISGAGGQLRSRSVTRHMEDASIAGWAPARHFLAVDIEGRTMRIQPLGVRPVVVWDRNRQPLKTPFEVKLP